MNTELNCLSHWLPKLQAAGVPVPKTRLVHTEPDLRGDELLQLLDGNAPPGWEAFLGRLTVAVLEQYHETAALIPSGGEPAKVFLRTGQTSGKHNWKNTCCITDPTKVGQHVGAIAEYSAMAGFFGLPMNVWAVREFLAVEPIMTLSAYGDFPLVPEVRAFIREGAIVCIHAYWPPDAILKGMVREHRVAMRTDREKRAAFEEAAFLAGAIHVEDIIPLTATIQKVADAFKADGFWSVDLLKTTAQDSATPGVWYVTDMALGAQSFHMEGCPLDPKNTKTE